MPEQLDPKLIRFLESKGFYNTNPNNNPTWYASSWVKHEVSETETYDLDLRLRGSTAKTGIPSSCNVSMRGAPKRAAVKVSGRYKWLAMFDEIVRTAITLGNVTKKVGKGINYKPTAIKLLNP